MPKKNPVDTSVPLSMCCPLSYDALEHPVACSDGRVYEANELKKLGQDAKSPFTRAYFWPLPLPALNEQFKSIVSDWKEKNREWEKFTEELNKENKSLQEEVNLLRKELIKKNFSTPKTVFKKDLSIPPGALIKSRNNSQFLQAVRDGKLLKARSYARQKGVYIDTRDQDNGASALIIAIGLRLSMPSEAKDMIRMLCDEFHIDVDIKNFSGCSALHVATGNNDAWAVKFLLSKSANPLLRNNFADTPRQHGYKINHNDYDPSIVAELIDAESAYKMNSPISLFPSVPLQPVSVSSSQTLAKTLRV